MLSHIGKKVSLFTPYKGCASGWKEPLVCLSFQHGLALDLWSKNCPHNINLEIKCNFILINYILNDNLFKNWRTQLNEIKKIEKEIKLKLKN